MSTYPTPKSDLEEAAQGHDLFRAPGEEQQIEQARDQALASGWLPPDVVYQSSTLSRRDEIVGRRQDLYDAMRRLEASVTRASAEQGWATQVRESLTNLDRALTRHVTETEAPDGILAEVVDRAPHLGAAVKGLRAEHEALTAACRAALDMMSEQTDPPRLRRKVVGILGRLTMHRQNGAELLFDAYNIELGGGD